ncbi:MAG: copper-binding protein [Burkholderiales bacterium]|nr:copper-binding protein [Burkholderiales bacterium]
MKVIRLILLALALAAAPAIAANHLAGGEVRKVDRDAQKVTIRHGPIPSLDMPPMTMVFQLNDPAMLERVKAGDRIRFSAEKAGGAYRVTRIEFAR